MGVVRPRNVWTLPFDGEEWQAAVCLLIDGLVCLLVPSTLFFFPSGLSRLLGVDARLLTFKALGCRA